MRWLVMLALAIGCGSPRVEEGAAVHGEVSEPDQTEVASGSEAASGSDSASESESGSAADSASDSAAESEAAVDAAAEDEAAAEAAALAALMAMDGSRSTSIGGPRDGRVEGAVPLPTGAPGLRSNPRRPNEAAFYGTVEMVQALVHAAGVVHEEMGGEVTVNDLGFEEGGAIAHHGSHRAGRDVDVLFYLLDSEGEPMQSVGAFLDPRGVGVDFKDLAVRADDVVVRIDAPRTWRFVQALLEGPHGDLVQRIFVAEHVRTLILRASRRAPSAVRERFEEITCQPGAPHDDHLHVRFFCTPEDMADGCEDSGPTYYWRVLALREHELRPAINRPRRDRPQAPTTSAEEARAAAGDMHARVTQWLTRREAWLDPPHPGRRYCR